MLLITSSPIRFNQIPIVISVLLSCGGSAIVDDDGFIAFTSCATTATAAVAAAAGDAVAV
jgi:hypothetical protein